MTAARRPLIGWRQSSRVYLTRLGRYGGHRMVPRVQRLRLLPIEETERCTRCGGSGLVMVADRQQEGPNGQEPARTRQQD
jgi:hypothetical protein